MEGEAESEMGVDGYQFPFNDEEEFSFGNGEEDVPESPYSFNPLDDDGDGDSDDRPSNVFRQILEINHKMYKITIDYEAELEKRGAPFKFGWVNKYLLKFPFEDEEDVPNSEYCIFDDDEKFKYRKNAHEVAKRFLRQVRESNGYDVDCYPLGLCSPFSPVNLNKADKNMLDAVMRMTHFAIEKINAEKGKTFELVQVENAVYTDNFYYLLTFTVKEAGTNGDDSLKIIRALVDEPYCNNDDYKLEEWMFKPPAQIHPE